MASYASIPDVPTAQLPDIYNVYGAVGVALNDDSVLIAGGRQVAFLINSSPLSTSPKGSFHFLVLFLTLARLFDRPMPFIAPLPQ